MVLISTQLQAKELEMIFDSTSSVLLCYFINGAVLPTTCVTILANAYLPNQNPRQQPYTRVRGQS